MKAEKDTGEPLPDETVRFLFQRDTLLSRQFFSARIRSALVPEKRLLLAVLEDALYCFQDTCSAKHGKRKELYSNVEEWFFDKSDDRVFGFNNICSALGFDADYVRKGLLQWREKELSRQERSQSWKFTNQRAEPRA